MNSSDKKSFIPRLVQEFDRQPKVRVGSKSAVKHTSGPSHRQPPNPGLFQENNDAVHNSLLRLDADNAHMRETLEEGLRDAEERLEAMKKLMEERERRHAARMEESSKRNQSLEKEIEDMEKKLLENNINPVTSETLEASSEETEAVKKEHKVTKDDVKKMRNRLKEMNEKSDKFLVDIQHILQELSDLEESSARAGGLPVMDIPTDNPVLLTDDVSEVPGGHPCDAGINNSPVAVVSCGSPSEEEQLLPTSSRAFFTET